MAERTVTLLGPSKTESMSGYRVGVAVSPAPIADAMERVLSLMSLRTGGYSQQVLRHWMADDDDWLAERTVAHEAIRDQVVTRLRGIPGVHLSAPAGSSYVFPDASGTALGSNDHEIAVALKAAGVMISPGYQFGPAGRGRFRINFSQDVGRLTLALDRIGADRFPHISFVRTNIDDVCSESWMQQRGSTGSSRHCGCMAGSTWRRPRLSSVPPR
jgi:aspartate/methionine/tyrosine aminotransferase